MLLLVPPSLKIVAESPPPKSTMMINRISPPIPPPTAFIGTLIPLLSSTFPLLRGFLHRICLSLLSASKQVSIISKQAICFYRKYIPRIAFLLNYIANLTGAALHEGLNLLICNILRKKNRGMLIRDRIHKADTTTMRSMRSSNNEVLQEFLKLS